MILLIIGIAILTVACTTTPQTPQLPADSMADEEVSVDSMMIPSDASFAIDTDRSVMKWHSSKIIGGDHNGKIMIDSGSLELMGGSMTGDFVIDMTSISDDDASEALVGHLKSEDFFNVEMYPKSQFVITSATMQDESTYLVTGDLTILDKTNMISFPATIVYDGSDLSAKASFSIDRTQWGIEFKSGSVFKDLGDAAIKDDIDF